VINGGEEMEQQQIFKAMPKIMGEVEAIGKKKGGNLNYKFRGIDDVYNALNKVMADNEVFTTSEILSEEINEITSKNGTRGFHAKVKYKWTFHAGDGSHVNHETYGEAMDYGDKALNKCMSISHKYALFTAFCIPTEDQQDPDEVKHEIKEYNNNPDKTVTQPQLKRLMAIANKREYANENVSEMIKYLFKKDSSKELNMGEYDELIKLIETNTYQDIKMQFHDDFETNIVF